MNGATPIFILIIWLVHNIITTKCNTFIKSILVISLAIGDWCVCMGNKSNTNRNKSKFMEWPPRHPLLHGEVNWTLNTKVMLLSNYILRDLEAAARLGANILVSPWNVTGSSTANPSSNSRSVWNTLIVRNVASRYLKINVWHKRQVIVKWLWTSVLNRS